MPRLLCSETKTSSQLYPVSEWPWGREGRGWRKGGKDSILLQLVGREDRDALRLLVKGGKIVL